MYNWAVNNVNISLTENRKLNLSGMHGGCIFVLLSGTALQPVSTARFDDTGSFLK